jgi:hypothetical protein
MKTLKNTLMLIATATIFYYFDATAMAAMQNIPASPLFNHKEVSSGQSSSSSSPVNEKKSPFLKMVNDQFQRGLNRYHGLGCEKNLEAAQKHFEDVITYQEDIKIVDLDAWVKSHYYLGCIYYSKKNNNKAQEHFKAILETADAEKIDLSAVQNAQSFFKKNQNSNFVSLNQNQ